LSKVIDNKTCQRYHSAMLDVEVIDDPAAASVALEAAEPTAW
jgi:hypothetical protein